MPRCGSATLALQDCNGGFLADAENAEETRKSQKLFIFL